MKQWLFFQFLFVLLIASLLSSCSISGISHWDTKNSNQEKINQDIPLEDPSSNEEKKVDPQEIQEKISLIRGRYAIKWLVSSGDTYLENKQLTLALKSYLWALKQNKDDPVIINKIAETYFEMNKYKVALNYYKNISPEQIINKQRYILSYLYTLEISSTSNFTEIEQNINNSWLDQSEIFFYNTSLKCIKDMKSCINMYTTYLWQYKTESKNLLYITTALANYKSQQIESDYFKHTQIMGALFQARLYPITNIIWEQILLEKPWYLPVLKMIWKGYFEMWKYELAKKTLLKHNSFEPNDPKVNYTLGIINIKLHEYVLSNIYFMKALKEWFGPRSTIARRLIYNYYLIEDMDKVLKEFNILITSGDASPIDYSLWIYYSLINDKKIQATKWTNDALQKYENEAIFYWYKWWILKENNNLSDAEKYLKKWYKITPQNPLINLNLWLIEYKKWNALKAKIHLRNTIGADPKGKFWEIASIELARIKQEETSRKQKLEKQIEANISTISQ